MFDKSITEIKNLNKKTLKLIIKKRAIILQLAVPVIKKFPDESKSKYKENNELNEKTYKSIFNQKFSKFLRSKLTTTSS
jgi:hypothetical protein